MLVLGLEARQVCKRHARAASCMSQGRARVLGVARGARRLEDLLALLPRRCFQVLKVQPGGQGTFTWYNG